MKKDAQNVVNGWFTWNIYAQNDVTQVKLFIMTVKSLLEVKMKKVNKQCLLDTPAQKESVKKLVKL